MLTILQLTLLGCILIINSSTSTFESIEAINNTQVITEKKELPVTQSGVASYYDYVLDSGWSSVGHRVCATRDWKRYSYIRVTNIDNGKYVICRVTDYGPDASIFPERIVDLSSYSFSQIADLKLGTVNVIITKE